MATENGTFSYKPTTSGIYTWSFRMKNSGTVAQPASVYYLDNLQVSYPYPYTRIDCDKAPNASYRYGFNGKESDDEVNGNGNIYDYGFRIYNPRIGRFLSVDPLAKSYPWYTPYQFAGNNPTLNIDLDGAEELNYNLFSQNLKEGANMLKTISFPNNGRLVTSFNSDWVNGSGRGGRKVTTSVANKSPSEVVSQFAEHSEQFMMDCGTYCQAVILTGLMNTMGAEKFNSYVISQTNNTGVMTLSNGGSTGLIVTNQWLGSNGKLQDMSGTIKSEKKLVSEVGIGTVMNLESSFLKETVYGNENIVKVGDDQYIAQGLGNNNPLSYQQVKEALVQYGVDNGYVQDSNSARKSALKSKNLIQVNETVATTIPPKQ